MFSFKLITFAAVVGYITAFPSGAPANICGRYVPGGHRNMGTPVANGPTTGPYKLDVTPSGNGLFTGMNKIRFFYTLFVLHNFLLLKFKKMNVHVCVKLNITQTPNKFKIKKLFIFC
jgi:hypothetical protein